jgi:hypothetical protein
MKEIPLTQGKVALVDDEDFEWISQWKWCAGYNHKHWYAFRGRLPTVYMHREIMKTPIDMVTDHIDHNGLNNCKYNMKNCTVSQNSRNSVSRYGESKYKGVYWNKARSKWHARITTDNGRVHLGFFSNEEEAAATCRAAEERRNNVS